MTRRREMLAGMGAGMVALLSGCTVGDAGSRTDADPEASESPLSLVAVRSPRFAQQGEPFSVEFTVWNTGDRPKDLDTAIEVKEEDTWEVAEEVTATIRSDERASFDVSDHFFHFVSRQYRLAAFDTEVTVKTMCNCTHI